MFAGSLSPPTATSVQLVCERGFLLSVSPALGELGWHQVLLGSLLSHLSVSGMEPHGLRLHVPHLQAWFPASACFFLQPSHISVLSLHHVSALHQLMYHKGNPRNNYFVLIQLFSNNQFASVWPGSNINTFLCPSMEEKQIN